MVHNWRERFLAAAIHFLITLALAGLAAALIFFVWYPGELAAMVGGTELFLIIIAVDVGLGPLVSLVIYSSRKPRRELIIDYTLVGLVQIAALVYGVFTLSVARPVFVVAVPDRLEVVTAVEIEESDLAAADPAYRRLSWTGPKLAAVQMPTDPRQREEIMMAAVMGKDVQMMPKYFRPYEAAAADLDRISQPLDSLPRRNEAEKQRVERAIAAADAPPNALRWVLVHHRFGFAVALIDAHTRRPLRYILMDPTEPPGS